MQKPEFGILPTPALIRHLPGPALDLGRGIALSLHGLDRGAIAAALHRFELRASGIPVNIVVNGRRAPESYHLSAHDGRVDIIAADTAGAFYALQSLSQQSGLGPRPLKARRDQRCTALRLPWRPPRPGAKFPRQGPHVLKVIGLDGRIQASTRLHLHLGDDEAAGAYRSPAGRTDRYRQPPLPRSFGNQCACCASSPPARFP